MTRKMFWEKFKRKECCGTAMKLLKISKIRYEMNLTYD